MLSPMASCAVEVEHDAHRMSFSEHHYHSGYNAATLPAFVCSGYHTPVVWNRAASAFGREPFPVMKRSCDNQKRRGISLEVLYVLPVL